MASLHPSGHSDAFPRISSNSSTLIIRSGILFKESSGIVKRWQPRHFTLTSTGALLYSHSGAPGEARQPVVLDALSIARPVRQPPPGSPGHVFSLVSYVKDQPRVLLLSAGSEDDRDGWVTDLNTAIKTHVPLAAESPLVLEDPALGEPLHRGWVWLRGAGGKWQRVWGVLSGTALCLYRDESALRLAAHVPIAPNSACNNEPSDIFPSKAPFSVCADADAEQAAVCVLAAEDRADADAWLAAVQSAIRVQEDQRILQFARSRGLSIAANARVAPNAEAAVAAPVITALTGGKDAQYATLRGIRELNELTVYRKRRSSVGSLGDGARSDTLSTTSAKAPISSALTSTTTNGGIDHALVAAMQQTLNAQQRITLSRSVRATAADTRVPTAALGEAMALHGHDRGAELDLLMGVSAGAGAGEGDTSSMGSAGQPHARLALARAGSGGSSTQAPVDAHALTLSAHTRSSIGQGLPPLPPRVPLSATSRSRTYGLGGPSAPAPTLSAGRDVPPASLVFSALTLSGAAARAAYQDLHDAVNGPSLLNPYRPFAPAVLASVPLPTIDDLRYSHTQTAAAFCSVSVATSGSKRLSTPQRLYAVLSHDYLYLFAQRADTSPQAYSAGKRPLVCACVRGARATLEDNTLTVWPAVGARGKGCVSVGGRVALSFETREDVAIWTRHVARVSGCYTGTGSTEDTGVDVTVGGGAAPGPSMTLVSAGSAASGHSALPLRLADLFAGEEQPHADADSLSVASGVSATSQAYSTASAPVTASRARGSTRTSGLALSASGSSRAAVSHAGLLTPTQAATRAPTGTPSAPISAADSAAVAAAGARPPDTQPSAGAMPMPQLGSDVPVSAEALHAQMAALQHELLVLQQQALLQHPQQQQPLQLPVSMPLTGSPTLAPQQPTGEQPHTHLFGAGFAGLLPVREGDADTTTVPLVLGGVAGMPAVAGMGLNTMQGINTAFPMPLPIVLPTLVPQHMPTQATQAPQATQPALAGPAGVTTTMDAFPSADTTQVPKPSASPSTAAQTDADAPVGLDAVAPVTGSPMSAEPSNAPPHSTQPALSPLPPLPPRSTVAATDAPRPSPAPSVASVATDVSVPRSRLAFVERTAPPAPRPQFPPAPPAHVPDLTGLAPEFDIEEAPLAPPRASQAHGTARGPVVRDSASGSSSLSPVSHSAPALRPTTSAPPSSAPVGPPAGAASSVPARALSYSGPEHSAQPQGPPQDSSASMGSAAYALTLTAGSGASLQGGVRRLLGARGTRVDPELMRVASVPQEPVDALSALEGWALKRKRSGKKWQVRYFMLVAGAAGEGLRLAYFTKKPESCGARLGLGPLPLAQRERGSVSVEGAMCEEAEAQGGFGVRVTTLVGEEMMFAVATRAEQRAWVEAVMEASRAVSLVRDPQVSRDTRAGRVTLSGYLWAREGQAWVRRFVALLRTPAACVFPSHIAYEAARGHEDAALRCVGMSDAVVALVPNDEYDVPFVVRVEGGGERLELRTQSAREYQVWVTALMGAG